MGGWGVRGVYLEAMSKFYTSCGGQGGRGRFYLKLWRVLILMLGGVVYLEATAWASIYTSWVVVQRFTLWRVYKPHARGSGLSRSYHMGEYIKLMSISSTMSGGGEGCHIAGFWGYATFILTRG